MEAEREVLERYASIYSEARANGTPRELTREIVEQARESLRVVSGREWDNPAREPYEVRQWFNRWMKTQRRKGARTWEAASGQMTEAEANVDIEMGISTCDSQPVLSWAHGNGISSHEPELGLLWWDGPPEPLFDEDMPGMCYDYWGLYG